MQGIRSITPHSTAFFGSTLSTAKMQGIMIQAKALSRDKAWILLSYAFVNSDRCTQELNKGANSVL